jgi:hypothetical protein
MEEMRLLPSLDAARADADWKVAFEEDAKAPGIIGSIGELRMQKVLDKSIILHFLGIPLCILQGGTSVIDGKLFPLREARRAVGVTQMTEDAVWLEPFGIL